VLRNPVNIIRSIAIISFFVFLVSSRIASAQTEKLPVILQPDVLSEGEAKRVGGKVFKLVPRSMFPDVSNSYVDKDNPVGIRGGGSYYSFTTESHSFNRIPQICMSGYIGLQEGWAGVSLFSDLGVIDLGSINSSSAEADQFLSYRPPLLLRDFIKERIDLSRHDEPKFKITGHIRTITIGHVYLYRSIIAEKADVVVALQIVKRDADDSITIIWKQLAEFPPPIVLEMSDQEMQKKVDTIVKAGNFAGDQVVVKNNHIYFLGPNFELDPQIENAVIKSGLRTRGFGGDLPN